MIWLTSITLAGMEAVTTLSIVLIDWVDKLVSRINPTMKLSVLTSTSGMRSASGPRNLIEEFDPGSA